jgi:two-component system sensor histidine kinase MtrB
VADRAPLRFRRRLTAAFVIVAAISAGLVATVTVLLARENRWRSFRAAGLDEARFAAAVSPSELDDQSFQAFRVVYERRSAANIVAVAADGDVFSSSPDLGLDDVPAELRDVAGEDPQLVESTVAGRPVLVAGAAGRDEARYFLFFSLDQLHRGNDELTQAAIVSWLAVVVLAGAVGRVVAKRTLRPVAVVAEASEAIAAGDLSTRLPSSGRDEFGVLADSFNHMVDEVQASIAELAEAAARERRLTADLAHELRTPLTAMSAAAQLLSDELSQLPPDAAAVATVLAEDIARLRRLVQTLLELAALDASSEPPHLEAVDVADAIEQAVVAARVPATVPVEVHAEDGTAVLADPVRLGRILANLIENAVVHGRGASIEITAGRDGSTVHIDVLDHGPGIEPDDLERVFDRFYTSDRSRSTGGSGLGLAIASQYATSLGGTLAATSEPGSWTRLRLDLPAVEG